MSHRGDSRSKGTRGYKGRHVRGDPPEEEKSLLLADEDVPDEEWTFPEEN